MGEGDAVGDEGIDEGGVALVPAVVEGFVQSTDILASETLDDQHDDILPDEGGITVQTVVGHDVGLVDRTVDHCQSLGAEVVGHHEDILADGAIEGEGRIEHQRGLDGMVGILVGIRDGDGAHGRGEAASDACHCEGGHEEERQEHGDIILPPDIMTLAEARGAIALIEGPDNGTEDEDQVEVVHHLLEEDGTQVALIGELAEDGGRGAAHREAEIDRIAEVDEQCQPVDAEVHPFTDLLIEARLLPMPGQEHEHDIGDVGDEDG